MSALVVFGAFFLVMGVVAREIAELLLLLVRKLRAPKRSGLSLSVGEDDCSIVLTPVGGGWVTEPAVARAPMASNA